MAVINISSIENDNTIHQFQGVPDNIAQSIITLLNEGCARQTPTTYFHLKAGAILYKYNDQEVECIDEVSQIIKDKIIC